MASIFDRFRKRAWDFLGSQPNDNDPFAEENPQSYGSVSSIRPDLQRFGITNERSMVTSIYTRIAIDVASVMIKHVRLDDQDRYLADIPSYLNEIFTISANLDQAATHFRQDLAYTLCSSGVMAIVPVDTTQDPRVTNSYDIVTMRVGDITAWWPDKVKTSVYNERTGKREEITLPKTYAAVVENPLYAVMNAPNSTLQRLARKLNLLDTVDEASASGKLDLIIQLPYVIKSEARKAQAEQRRSDIEFQLKGSKYGIAYTDGTEKITQLNRPAENNLMTQIEYLTEMLYGQLGITKEVMNGTANEETMLNYWNRTIHPLVRAIVESMRRTFLTKTARTQKQSIMYFRDPFQLVPVAQIAEIADKFTRNEILSSNEIRQIVGFKPSTEPKADQLVNSNMPQGDTGVPATDATDPTVDGGSDDEVDGEFGDLMDELDGELDGIFADLGGEPDDGDPNDS